MTIILFQPACHGYGFQIGKYYLYVYHIKGLKFWLTGGIDEEEVVSKINSRELDNHITGHYGEDQHRAVLLIQSCNLERVDEEDVECLNIEEDIQGRDVVTFKCPNCGEEHKSVRLG